jgi:hypothetical protein
MRSNASRWVAPISGCSAKFCSQQCSQILGRRRAGDGTTRGRACQACMREKSNPKPARCERDTVSKMSVDGIGGVLASTDGSVTCVHGEWRRQSFLAATNRGFGTPLMRVSSINRNLCEAQPQLSEAVGSFVDRRAKAAERRPKDYVEWREHTDAAISGHDRRGARHVTRTPTSDHGMQR